MQAGSSVTTRYMAAVVRVPCDMLRGPTLAPDVVCRVVLQVCGLDQARDSGGSGVVGPRYEVARTCVLQESSQMGWR